MTLQIILKEDCSTKVGVRKLDRKDRYRLREEKKLKSREEWKSAIDDIRDKVHHDIYVDPKLGIVRIKKRSYNKETYSWRFQFTKDDKKDFNYLECHCLDEKGNNERTYIIPRYDIKSYIVIKKSRKNNWYDKYMVDV